MRIQTAKATSETFTITCPHCGQVIPAPNGSLFWTLAELQCTFKLRRCSGCDSSFFLPSK